MSLILHYHPLASFCWKALIGLYELEIPFQKHLVDLGDPDARAAFGRLWPLAKFPVLRDETRGRTVPESTILLEYVDLLRDGTARLIPSDPARALECRLRDRLFDTYVHAPMQKIVGDRLRPADARDGRGVEEARGQLEAAYALLEEQAVEGPWAMGTSFTLADCAAMPALYYANEVHPFAGRRQKLTAYLEELKQRPSVARVLVEAAPYLHMFPR